MCGQAPSPTQTHVTIPHLPHPASVALAFLNFPVGPSFLPPKDHHVCSSLCQKPPLPDSALAQLTLPSTQCTSASSRRSSSTHQLGHMPLLRVQVPLRGVLHSPCYIIHLFVGGLPSIRLSKMAGTPCSFHSSRTSCSQTSKGQRPSPKNPEPRTE